MRGVHRATGGRSRAFYTPTLVIPVSGRRPAAPIRQDRADASRSYRELTPQERKRGLFHATVYYAKVDMTGAFVIPAELRLRDFVADKDGRFLWNETTIAFGTPANLTGLRAADNITIDGTETQWMPCLEALRQERPARAPRGAGERAALARCHGEHTHCLQGRRQPARHQFVRVQFAGKEMVAKFQSPWPSPSFTGNTLPLNSSRGGGVRGKLADHEFGSPRITAASTIMDPQMWKGSTIGVDLIEATPIYRMITRVAKYGLLFVVLSFATYFFFEVLEAADPRGAVRAARPVALAVLAAAALARRTDRVHQWLPDGGRHGAVQSTLYTAAVSRRFVPTLMFAAMLSSLFGFLYVLLGLETYSLLIGAVALFIVVSALMVLTQMVNLPRRLSSAPA